MKNKFFIVIAFVLFSLIGKAQNVMSEPEMADVFRSNGKIFVVIAVLTITFISIIGYLVYIDIKLKKLEQKK